MEEIFTPGAASIALVVLAKMGIGVFLGGAIGFERERHGRPAGLRTHMLVALGVVLFCIISAAYPGADPTRISAQVVTGIGFLGAGTILRLGAEVRGLTSAASIWATAAVAMAVARGGPYMIVAVVSTLFALLTLSYVEKIEKKYKPKMVPTELVVTLANRAGLHDVLEKLNYDGFEVKSVRMLQSTPTIQASLQIGGPGASIMQSISTIHSVTEAKWSDGTYDGIDLRAGRKVEAERII